MFPWSLFAGFNETSNLNVRDEIFKTPWNTAHDCVYYIYIYAYICVCVLYENIIYHLLPSHAGWSFSAEVDTSWVPSPSGSVSKSMRNFEKHLAGKLASDVADWESNPEVHMMKKSTPWIPMATARRFKTQWNIMKHDSDRPSPNAESLHILRKSKILRIAKFAALYLGIPSRPAVQRLTKTFNFSLIQIWFSGIQWWTIRQHKGKVQIDLQTASRTGMDSMAPRWTAFRKTPLIRSRNSWIGVTKHHKYHNKTMQNHTGCARATFVFPVVAYGCLVSCSFSEPAMCSLRHPGVACTTMVDASQENIARKHGDARGKS